MFAIDTVPHVLHSAGRQESTLRRKEAKAMRYVVMTALVAIMLAVASAPALAQVYQTCGFKPFVPFGCDDLICIDGTWHCVKY